MYEVEVLQDDAAPEGTLDAQAVAVYMFHGEHPPPAAEREVTTKGGRGRIVSLEATPADIQVLRLLISRPLVLCDATG